MPRITIKEMSGEPGDAVVELAVSIGVLVLDIRFTDGSATPGTFPSLIVNERLASGGVRRLVTEELRPGRRPGPYTDHFTNTPEDAAAFERATEGGV